ncbi:NADH dehydrogenase (quinone) [Alkalilimnicola ehrlichii MLHE-1]|uniref:NADH dehydrogenase (Quinone) n=2 Tax=Alkalilimnicola ehrlichii TaxID=351052 RepID=Q0AAN9_ALKEH|nr:NADH dehydrogenase (quinone) [Alkalilimnicola ehrlichii MLHE-1]
MSALYTAMPLWVLMTSLVTAVVIFLLGERRQRARTAMNLGGALAKLALVAVMLFGVWAGHDFHFRWAVIPGGPDIVLHADALAMLFISLSALLWLLTTVYAIGYLEGQPHRCRFFGFFSLCVAATMGIATAGNLFTFFIFYELLTLSTWPLVVHKGTHAALRGGAVYLRYTLGAGLLLLPGIIGFYLLTGLQSFQPGGVVGEVVPEQALALTVFFWMMALGIGVKAALVPLHGWLPTAMVAPAPVSALLHAVAVVKAGAFGIVRLVQDLYGISVVAELGVGVPLALLASFTILYGSWRALAQDDIKRRLAFSTVSQVAYITLGVAVAGPVAAVGGLVHLVHQGLMKITLFFCAGNVAETLGVHSIRDLDGTGRRMPLTMAAFTLGAFGMIGAPPLAGFISKWHLGIGMVEAGMPAFIAVLVASTLLNAAYFLPVLHRIWFRPPPDQWPNERDLGPGETHGWLLWPTLTTAAMALGAGLLAGMPFSPLDWVSLIIERDYGLVPQP